MSASFSGNYLVLAPQSVSSADQTSAALVVSQETFSDVRFSASFETVEQLRTGSAPNPWECAWAIFAYTDNQHFYYVAFKPNGWELGKVDPAYPGGQRFLATGSTPASLIGEQHSFDIVQDGSTISVWLDGELLVQFTDTERPYLSGKIGFYTEDAKVAFDNVTGSINEQFEAYSDHSFTDGAKLGSVWETPFVGYGFGAIVAGATSTDTSAHETLKLFDLPLSDSPTNFLSVGGRRKSKGITGTQGADQLSDSGVKAVKETLTGGAGDDTYIVNSASTVVSESPDGGVDTVRSHVANYTLGANVENIVLSGSMKQTATGNSGSNFMIANGNGSVLDGAGGDDILQAGIGGDTLTGGEGSDIFRFVMIPEKASEITDFVVAEDMLDLRSVWQSLGYGGSDPVTDGYLVFRQEPTGGTAVYVDTNGRDAGGEVLLAVLRTIDPSGLQYGGNVW